MRFLLGLGFGALTTLSGALLLDWPAAEVALEPVINPEPVAYSTAPAQAPPPPAASAAAHRETQVTEPATTPSSAKQPALPPVQDELVASPPALADSTPPAVEPPPAVTAQAPEPEPIVPVTAPTAASKASVWRPFHSQLSAEGFARRLSMQLGYPFEVLKVDAAEYHVVFSYSDEAQRQTLSAQVLELTGYQPRP